MEMSPGRWPNQGNLPASDKNHSDDHQEHSEIDQRLAKSIHEPNHLHSVCEARHQDHQNKLGCFARIVGAGVFLLPAEMIERQRGRHAAARCSLNKPCLDQKRLINVFDGILFFADGSGQSLDPDGSAGKLVDQREQQHRIHFVEPEPVHFEHEQGFVGQPPW